jgi:hypothetical protein
MTPTEEEQEKLVTKRVPEPPFALITTKSIEQSWHLGHTRAFTQSAGEPLNVVIYTQDRL